MTEVEGDGIDTTEGSGRSVHAMGINEVGVGDDGGDGCRTTQVDGEVADASEVLERGGSSCQINRGGTGVEHPSGGTKHRGPTGSNQLQIIQAMHDQRLDCIARCGIAAAANAGGTHRTGELGLALDGAESTHAGGGIEPIKTEGAEDAGGRSSAIGGAGFHR